MDAIKMPKGIIQHLYRERCVFLLSVLVAILTITPYIGHTLHPLYRGMTIIRDKDFGNYYSRMERALRGYGFDADNGITPVGSGIDGVQGAATERAIGFFFGWTGLSAPTVSVILGPILSAILFVLFFLLFRVLEFSRHWSIGMTVTYFALTLPMITRFVHPGWSFIPAFGALITLFSFWKHPIWKWAIASGVLLGLLPYVYFWSWTFVWAAAGSAMLLAVLVRSQSDVMLRYPVRFICVGVMAASFSLPFILHAITLSHHPSYHDVMIRGSFLFTRSVESLPRTVLLITQTILFLSLIQKYRHDWSYRATLALLLGILLAMHQNIFHGKILMFASHYYPHLLIATIVAGGWVMTHSVRSFQRISIASIAIIFLLAAGYDYIPGNRFFFSHKDLFAYQHIREPIEILRSNGTNDTVLTDANTGRLLTAWTEDGILYTTHSRFLLISDEEMAERYCMTEIFEPDMPNTFRTIYMEYNDVLNSPEMREKERSLVTQACTRVRADPKKFLEAYGVTHILWNHNDRPTWNIMSRGLPLKVIASDHSWLLLSYGD